MPPLITLYILALDFENNSFMNMAVENGCPMQRAFKRAGIDMGKKDYYNVSKYFKQKSVIEADDKVCKMFLNMRPIEDFSFQIEL